MQIHSNPLIIFGYLILIFFNAVTSAPDATGMANDFSDVLGDFARDLKHVEMQGVFHNIGVTSEPFNGEEQIEALAESVSTRLQAKMDALETVRMEIEELALNRGQLSSGDDLQCCYYNPGAGDEVSTAFNKPVDFERTCVRIPAGLDGTADFNDPLIIEDRDLSRPLFDTWEGLYTDDTDLRWQYFGAESGLFRKFPADERDDCGNYDPRFRPWYVAAITPKPKNVILVIDISGSMADANNLYGISRIDRAKEAAVTVLSTLGPNDYVHVIAFSSDVERPPNCHGQQMVKATPENIVILKNWVNDLLEGGQTFYGLALTDVFVVYEHHMEISPDDPTAIIFLTDGAASDGTDWQTALDAAIDDDLVDNVYLFPFAFGDSVQGGNNADTLNDMAAFLPNPTQAKFIPDDGDLRTELGKYYTFEAFQRDDTSYDAIDIIWTVPYLDSSGLGLVTTAAVPVYDRSNAPHELIGVLAIDAPLEELLQDMAAFETDTTYGFIVDSRSRTIVHPNLPTPDAYEAGSFPIYLDISMLESATTPTGADVFEVGPQGVARQGMRVGIPGSTTNVDAVRAVPLGDPEYSGAARVEVSTDYYWTPLTGTDFTLGIAKDVSYNQQNTPDPQDYDDLPSTDFYHRLDLMDEAEFGELCDQLGSPSSVNHPVFMVAPRGYSNKLDYTLREETEDDVRSMIDHVEQRGDQIFGFGKWKDGILEDVLTTSLINTDWQESQAGDLPENIIWRYVGTKNGVFRTFPGHQMAKTYDATVRPWYLRSAAFPDKISLSIPYEDSSGAGVVITLSKAVMDKFDDTLAGVMGMDFTVGKLLQVLKESTGGKCVGTTRCLVIDSSGFLVLHPHFLTSNNENMCNAYDNENVFLGQCEPSLADALVDDGILEQNACNNFEDKKEQQFWRVNIDGEQEGEFAESCGGSGGVDFSIAEIPGTNLYFIAYDGSPEYCPEDCACDNNGVCEDDSCHCVCQGDLDFNTCTESFSADARDYPTCPLTPPTSAVRDDLTYLYNDLDWEEACYDFECENRAEEECTTLGCVWCVLAKDGDEYVVQDNPGCITGNSLDDCDNLNSPGTDVGGATQMSLRNLWIVVFVGVFTCLFRS